MNQEQYVNKVIELFRSGKATNQQYTEMANAVLVASEWGQTQHIDSGVGVDDETEDSD